MQFASAVVRLIYFTVLIYWWRIIISLYHVLFFNSKCFVYCNLNESQRDLRMISFCTILKFRHLHQE